MAVKFYLLVRYDTISNILWNFSTFPVLFRLHMDDLGEMCFIFHVYIQSMLFLRIIACNVFLRIKFLIIVYLFCISRAVSLPWSPPVPPAPLPSVPPHLFLLHLYSDKYRLPWISTKLGKSSYSKKYPPLY